MLYNLLIDGIRAPPCVCHLFSRVVPLFSSEQKKTEWGGLPVTPQTGLILFLTELLYMFSHMYTFLNMVMLFVHVYVVLYMYMSFCICICFFVCFFVCVFCMCFFVSVFLYVFFLVFSNF